MKKTSHLILICLIAILFINDTLFCKPKSIKEKVIKSGLILNKKGESIYGAHLLIKLINKNNKIINTFNEFTDEKGQWSILLKRDDAGFLDITVSAYGYITKNFIDDLKEKAYVFKWSKKNHQPFRQPIKKFQLLDKDLNTLEWGTKDWALLHCKAIDRKTIDDFMKANQLEGAKKYCHQLTGVRRNAAFAFIGYRLFEKKKTEKARPFFKRAGLKNWYNLMGKLYLDGGDNEKASSYYQKGDASEKRAEFFKTLGDHYLKDGNLEYAKGYYEKAISDYEELMKFFRYTWKPDFIEQRKECMEMRDKLAGPSKKNPHLQRLQKLLDKAGKYCQKVEDAAIYYFCQERKVEMLNHSRDLEEDLNTGLYRKNIEQKKPKTNLYIYDYQLIKEGKNITEKRKRLKRKIRLRKKRETYKVTKTLYGPSSLLNYKWQKKFHYKIIGTEIINKEPLVIVEAFPTGYFKDNLLFGKAWINEENGSVFKIEWYPRNTNIGEDEIIKRNIWLFKAEPKVKCVSEFGFVKNSIRFPSKTMIEEFYIGSTGEKFVRIKITITHSKYSFFRVDFSVSEEKVEHKKPVV